MSGAERALRAVYRLRLDPGPELAPVSEVVSYLAALGISHLSVSAPGGDRGWHALASTARAHGLEVLLELAGEPATGPEFADVVTALFADPAAKAALPALHASLVGDAERFGGGDVAAFHAANARRSPGDRLAARPRATSCSHDVRARLVALTAMAGEWAGAVGSWLDVNAELRSVRSPTSSTPGRPADPHTSGALTEAEERLIYRTLAGTWPIDAPRLERHLLTALREAGGDPEHEAAATAFAVALLDHGPFRYGFDAVVARVSEIGRRIALAQTLLRLTVPGAPELDQGDERWTYTLGDPGPVDWTARHTALEELARPRGHTHETAKLALIAVALDLRRRRPEAFGGDYVPIAAGEDAVAFLRGGSVLSAVVVRDVATGAGGWELPDAAAGRWRDVLSGAEHELPGGATLAGVLGPDGRALLERIG